ncbi:MAG TPA: diaminopimelate decarboxylase [Methanomicrobia archaeon]|mgnify:CR=1 FL=1|nr:diaminopimelate decarboxylase [Methanomicrobia archaeon]
MAVLQEGTEHLSFGGADVVELAQRYGTPLYVTDESVIRANFRQYKEAFATVDTAIYFAVKANGNLTILRILAQEGAGADVFSGGELELVKAAGIPLDNVLFNGNAKSEAELRAAVELDVTVSVDSREELQTVSAIASEQGKEAGISLRVNPDVSPDVNPKIATGLRTAKFGIPYEQIVPTYDEAAKLPHIMIKGIHCHIGSQILELSVFKEATEKMMQLVAELYDRGIELEFVDLGGGLGIAYEKAKGTAPTPYDLAAMILPTFKAKTQALGISPRLILEPGRSLVGPASILLTTVNTVKDAYKHFVAVDAGFNLFVRPAMYDAYHEVVVANKVNEPASVLSTVVGPICESGDIIAKDRMLPPVRRGDCIAILDTGAYGFSMSSQYNGRPRCAEVLVHDGAIEVIRDGESFEDILRHQRLPKRLR